MLTGMTPHGAELSITKSIIGESGLEKYLLVSKNRVYCHIAGCRYMMYFYGTIPLLSGKIL